MEGSGKMILHVEVKQKAESSLGCDDIEKKVEAFLNEKGEIFLDTVYSGEFFPQHVDHVRVCSDPGVYSVKLNRDRIQYRFYIYQTYSEVPEFDVCDEEDEDSPGASLNWALPNSEFEDLWDSLVLDSHLKVQLLNYVQTALLYSQNQVSQAIVRWNRVVLLHGPPGTGKTSLCKALAHKLSIRLNRKFSNGHLIEINTHSLFSKWYSESPKRVFKMFKTIKQWLECEENFVCILIDEVESLTHSREKVGMEPSDSIRVVNTVLTQLDQLQRYRNFVILATSNVTDAIDLAFADRADLKLFLGYPDKWAVYEILRSCIEELIRCRVIEGMKNEISTANVMKKLEENGSLRTLLGNSNALLDISSKCEGLSGRTLRKIPFLTSTKFIDKCRPDIKSFLKGLKEVIINHRNENCKYFKKKSCYTNGEQQIMDHRQSGEEFVKDVTPSLDAESRRERVEDCDRDLHSCVLDKNTEQASWSRGRQRKTKEENQVDPRQVVYIVNELLENANISAKFDWCGEEFGMYHNNVTYCYQGKLRPTNLRV